MTTNIEPKRCYRCEEAKLLDEFIQRRDECRSGLGINLIEIFTGGGFLSLQNPHDRCQYEPFYFGSGQCPF